MRESRLSTLAIRQILVRGGPVAMIPREEDELLNQMGLSKSMPDGWKWGDEVLERYDRPHIVLSDRWVRMIGAIKR